jgi:hypothetical protein
MNIIIKKQELDNATLELVFNAQETQHPLFTEKQDILNSKEELNMVSVDTYETVESINARMDYLSDKVLYDTKQEAQEVKEDDGGVLGIIEEFLRPTPKPEPNPEPEPVEPEPITNTNITIEIPIPEGESVMQVLGRQVDILREEYCGDVQNTYEDDLKDDEGNPIPDNKDLSDCPCFKIGETDK